MIGIQALTPKHRSVLDFDKEKGFATLYNGNIEDIITNCTSYNICCSACAVKNMQYNTYYPHMPIGKVWIYRLLFVCFFCVCLFVCTVTDFSTDANALTVRRTNTRLGDRSF